MSAVPGRVAGRWCAGRRPGRARPAGAAAPRPGAAPRPPAGARRPARKPPRPPTRHPRDVPAGPARPGAGARDPGPRGRPRRRPSTPARRRRARVISSIRLACWPTRSMAVIPPSTVRWSGSGSRSRPSAVIAPYRRLVPARRSRQPPAGPCWSVTASPVTVNTNSPLSCCSASRSWAIRRSRSSRAASTWEAAGEEAETGGLQRHRSPSVHTRPTDARLVSRALNTCNPSLQGGSVRRVRMALCGNPQRPPGTQSAQTTRRTSSSWAPMTVPQRLLSLRYLLSADGVSVRLGFP